MKYALVNPYWSFEGSTYFGCAEPHFPLELLSAREFLRSAGHEVLSGGCVDGGAYAGAGARPAGELRRGLPRDPNGSLLSVLALPATGVARPA